VGRVVCCERSFAVCLLAIHLLWKSATFNVALLPAEIAAMLTISLCVCFNHREEAMQEYVELVATLAGVQKSERAGADEDEAVGFGMNASIKGFTINTDGTSGDGQSSPERLQLQQQRLDLTHWASIDDVKSVKFCLTNQAVSPNYRDEDGLTALMRAADRDSGGSLRVLLAAGADVSARDDDGQTALHYAAICGHACAAKLLVRAGADPDVQDIDGTSARDAADGEVCAAMDAALSGSGVDVADEEGKCGGGGGVPWTGAAAVCAIAVAIAVAAHQTWWMV
jgi:Ankyrin repeats (3 copies)